MEITWYTTAALSLNNGHDRILFDPFVPLKGARAAVTTETYAEYRHIFITHGHLDHILPVPELLAGEKVDTGTYNLTPSASLANGGGVCVPSKVDTGTYNLTPSGSLTSERESDARPPVVYCTRTVKNTLIREGTPETSIREIAPGSEIRVGGLTVRVFRGVHSVFEKRLALEAVWKATVSGRLFTRFRDALRLSALNREFSEGRETVVFEVFADEVDARGTRRSKTVTILGSLGLDETENYTKNPELLALPFHGRLKPREVCAELIERLKPRAVLFDHFDDSFPPVSFENDPAPHLPALSERFPGTRFIVPESGTPLNL